MTRAERIHRNKHARLRRSEKKRCMLLCTLRKWARAHRQRIKHKKSLRARASSRAV